MQQNHYICKKIENLKVMSLTEDYLELFKTQMDTFTHHWDPLNDTVYWSNYEETRKYSR